MIVEALIAIAALCVIGYVFSTVWNRAVRRRRLAQSPWVLTEHADDTGAISVWAERPGEKPLYIGHARLYTPDFTSKIEEVRSEGMQKVVALNSGRRK